MDYEKELKCFVVNVFKKTIMGDFHKCKSIDFDCIELAVEYAKTYENEADYLTRVIAIYSIIF